MPRLGTRVSDGLLSVLGLGLLALMCLGIWNIIGRYVFSKAVLWADEITVFGIIAITWFGAIVSAWRGTEIRMSIVADMLPARAQWWIDLAQHVTVAGVCGWVGWLSYGYVSRLWMFSMKSDAAQMPVWIVHASVTIGLVVIALISCLRLVAHLRGGPDGAVVAKPPME